MVAKKAWRALGRAAGGIGMAAALSAGWSCGTTATGVEACRTIEEARCRQLPYCPSLRVHSSDDVSACVAFYRDQCLHGLTGADPGVPAVDQCVHTIEQAGACAAQQGETAALTSCAEAPSQSTTATTACALVTSPQNAIECAFLVPVPTASDDAGTQESGTEDNVSPTDGAPPVD